MSRMLCLGCNQPSRVDLAKCKPGEIHYKPCSCGAVGIYREGDNYIPSQHKKASKPREKPERKE